MPRKRAGKIENPFGLGWTGESTQLLSCQAGSGGTLRVSLTFEPGKESKILLYIIGQLNPRPRQIGELFSYLLGMLTFGQVARMRGLADDTLWDHRAFHASIAQTPSPVAEALFDSKRGLFRQG